MYMTYDDLLNEYDHMSTHPLYQAVAHLIREQAEAVEAIDQFNEHLCGNVAQATETARECLAGHWGRLTEKEAAKVEAQLSQFDADAEKLELRLELSTTIHII